MATDRERELFASKILSVVGEHAKELGSTELTGFLAMKGHAYDGGLMVIGRSVNGWRVTITPDKLRSSDEVNRFARAVQESVNGKDGKCPMLWVTELWGAREDYDTKHSAFWRCIRKVVQELDIANVEDANWPSHLVWSNLYKLSPAEGGNPGSRLREIQFPGCIELLKLEIQIYRPSRVLFLTGIDWAEPFLKKVFEMAQFQDIKSTYVERVGDAHGTRFVIAVHPQGKEEKKWVEEVVKAFKL